MTAVGEGEEVAEERAWARAIEVTEAAVLDVPAPEYRVMVDETVATVRPGRDQEGAPDAVVCGDALADLSRSVIVPALD